MSWGLKRRIQCLLEEHPEKEWTVAEVNERFPNDLPNTVRTTLAALGREGKIEKVDHGIYQSLPQGPK